MGWKGGVVKNKGFYHPNGSPPAQSPPRICVTLKTHTATPCRRRRRRQRVTGEVYPAPTTFFHVFFTLLRCVFLFRVCQTTTTGSAAADEPSAAATTTLPSSGGGGGGGYPPKEPANDSDPCICPMCQVRKGEGGHHNLF